MWMASLVRVECNKRRRRTDAIAQYATLTLLPSFPAPDIDNR